jgi:putative heme transporter
MKTENAVRYGRLAWAAIGVLALVALAVFAFKAVSLAVVPLVLALFPATLLVPVARKIEGWRIPRTISVLLALAAGLVLFFGLAAGTITLVVSEIPEIVDSAGEGVNRLEEVVGRVIPGFEVPAADELREMILERISGSSEEPGEREAGFASQALSVVTGAVEVLTGTILLMVFLFFYLNSGRRLAEAFAGFVAPRSRDEIIAFADEAWETLGSYFRGQLLVALADAVLIGVGLALLGVPLALPLAVIVFFGGLFPIIGAVVTGAVAVLVAFSDGGLAIGLGALGIVVVVQQLESNVLAPLILSDAIDLEPITVILSITMGAILFGMLGAFLAVPVVAVAKKGIIRLRGQAAPKGSGGPD